MQNDAPGSPRGSAAVPILLYHSIGPGTGRFGVHPDVFAQHLDTVAATGRVSLPIRALVDRPVSDTPVVSVSFDDGFADNLEVAAPLLAARGIEATVFITTSYVDGSARAPGAMLSPAGVRELHDAGVEIGSHGRRHVSFHRLTQAEVREEMRSSKSWLEDLLGVEVVSFAYPHGHHDRRGRDEAIAAGYRSASIVMNAVAEPEAEPYGIARLTIERRHDTTDVSTMMDQAPPGPKVRLRARAGSIRRMARAKVTAAAHS